MAINRRETTDGPRFDVEWRLPIAPSAARRSGPNAKPGSSKPRSSRGPLPARWSTHAPAAHPGDRVSAWLASRPISARRFVAATKTTGGRASIPDLAVGMFRNRPPIHPGLGQRDVGVGTGSPHRAVGSLGAEDDARLRDRRRPTAVAKPCSRTKFRRFARHRIPISRRLRWRRWPRRAVPRATWSCYSRTPGCGSVS